MKSNRTTVFCLTVLIVGTVMTTTNAQQRCLNNAVGVPSLSGPPNWWDSTLGAPQFQPEDDDPRWQGALADTFNNGAGEEASSRALYAVDSSGRKSIYLSFNTKLESTAVPSHHRVYIGLSDPAGSSAVVIRINLSTVSPTPTPETDANVRMFQRSGTTWNGISPLPAWINITGQTRVWIKSNNWSVHVRIPLTNTTNLNDGVNVGTGPTFLLWYTMMRGTPTSAGLPYFTIKRGSIQFANDNTTGADFPAPDATNWQETRFGPLNPFISPDPNCLNEGISLHYMDIGTTNPISTEIKWKIPPGSTTRPTNTFFVRPRFNVASPTAMPTPIPVGGLTAKFRMANWGSQLDPNQVATRVVLWDDVPGGDAVSNDVPIPIASPTPPPGSIVPYPAPTPPAGPATPIHFDWQLTDDQAADFMGTNPVKRRHQCFLVEFSGGSVSFFNKSAWNNLNFENASTMKRDAEISVVGLNPLPASTQRDVYLLIETLNMPPVRRQRGAVVVGKQAAGQHFDTKGMTGAGMTTKEIDKIMPTYRVYVYHATGKTLTTDGGVVLPLLEPQGSFGYYMRHDGDVEGWKHQLEGAVQLAPNFYLIKVPNNGKANVTTTIEAIEPGGGSNFKRWGLSLHASVSIPHGNFSNIFDPGPNFAVDLEYRLHPLFSLEGIYGLHHLNGDTLGGFTFSDLNVHQFSLNGKVYGSTSPVRPFANFGFGAYHFNSNTHVGLNAGAGLQFDVTPSFAVEGMYNFHNVFLSGSNFKFSAVQAGVRFRF